MSSGARKGSFATRVAQLFGLAVCCGIVYVAKRLAPQHGGAVDLITPVALFLMGGTLAGELLEPLRIPHLTAYLGIGIVSGPYVLQLVSHAGVEALGPVNGLALALIAFGGGAELRVTSLRRGARTLAWATFSQCIAVLLGATLLFAALSPIIPFARGGGVALTLGIALMWGAVSITRSPSAALGILAQTRARGPVADFTLAFVMLSDLVVLILAAAAITLVRPLVEAGASFSGEALQHLWREILGSVSLGTTLGLLTIAYMRFIHRQLVLVLVALGFGFTEVIGYLGFEPLLTFLVAGFLVQNMSPYGDELAHKVEDLGSVVYVLFFAIAGAELDLRLLAELWPIAIALFLGRVGLTVGANRLSTRLAGDVPALRRWGWTGLVSQAGIALGLAVTVERTYPRFGAGFKALGVATVALNEMIGPIMFKLALDRIGESSSAPEPSRASLRPPSGVAES